MTSFGGAPNQRLQIVFVLEYFHPHIGGVETLFDHLTAALASLGYRVSVITLWLPGSASHEVRNGVEIIRVRTPQRARRYLFMLFALPFVWRYGRRAALIHTTTYSAAAPAWLGSRLWRRPVVLTVHEVFGEQWHSLLGLGSLIGLCFRLFEWTTLHLPMTHYICDSEFTRIRLLEKMSAPASRTSVVYPAVDYSFWDRTRHRSRDLKRQLQLNPGGFVYLFFGRPGISKGVEYLIEAAHRIQREIPGSHLVLLLAKDPRDHYERLRDLITRGGLSNHISVLDPVPRSELPGYLLGADCIVVPSVSEGFGYSAVEAATLGCPVVATSGHSVQEILAGHVMLVPPRDPVALAAAVIKVARTRPTWPPPRRFEIDDHIARVMAIYARIGG